MLVEMAALCWAGLGEQLSEVSEAAAGRRAFPARKLAVELTRCDAPQTMALVAALAHVSDHIARDAAKGYPPIAPGGIAGPLTA
jgi:hypothetical protein